MADTQGIFDPANKSLCYQDEVKALTEYFTARLPVCGPLTLTDAERSRGVDSLKGLHSDLVRDAFVEWLAIRNYELSYNQTCIAFFTALEEAKPHTSC
jgi:hypothetical protein